ncbi:MAG TPA: hypothetical protein ENK57_07465 [Polyangiaceae bacterium]|nr:hypothetical protein [Polyangiaceae bacterium]
MNAALKAGSDDEACRNWYRAALAYIPFQRRDGAEAVAAKVSAGMGGGTQPDEREEPDEVVDDDSFDTEPPTQIARVAALPQMPSVPAPQATASMFPTDLEPAEEVPRDEATAIVSMDELRAMIEEDLREAKERGVDDGDDFLGQTAVRQVDDEVVAPPKLPPERPRRAAARLEPASETTSAEPEAATSAPAPPRMFPEPEPPPAPPEAAPPAATEPVRLESAPVVEAPAPTAEPIEEPEVPEPASTTTKKKRRSNTPLVIALLVTLVGVLLFGVRTGRLPALAKHLPTWVTGEAPLSP